MRTILELKHISKWFPGVVALDDVSIDFTEGEVHALVGENGAGKSTLIKTLTGYHKANKGTITYDGREYEGFDPIRAKELGIGVIYQELSLVNHLTVAENIFLSNLPKKGCMLNKKEMEQRTKALLEEMELPISPDTVVKDLTVGFQQMVELAKALVENSRVLILDEPTAPLSTHEVEILFHQIEKLRAKGITLIYISHRLDEIFRLADRVSVLRDGRLIQTLNIKETNQDQLIQLMVGRVVNEVYPKRPAHTSQEVLLETRNLTGNGVRDISLQIRKGEVLGLGGLVGAGRTEFAQLLFGAVKAESGEILFKGKPVQIKSPKGAMKLGIAMAPEDRKRQGLILEKPIKNNVALTVLEELSSAGILNKKKEDALMEQYIGKMRIKVSSVNQKAGELSGGNQQKVVLSKELAAKPELIIIDEPTRGIDVGAKQEIYKLMNELIAEGMTILMITSEMDELIGMSDRIAIFCEGRMTGMLEKNEFDSEKVLQFASQY